MMNILVKKGTEVCFFIERELCLHRQSLPDVKTSMAVYSQFEGYIQFNGSYHPIIMSDNHYKIQEEFCKGKDGFMFNFLGSLSYPIEICWHDYLIAKKCTYYLHRLINFAHLVDISNVRKF